MAQVLVSHDLSVGEFAMQIPMLDPTASLSSENAPAVEAMVASMCGVPVSVIDVHSMDQWTMNAQVADHYSSASGTVILCGDAAHTFPPAGGFGMNTGIQDAHNLAWKLAAARQDGGNAKSLLDTYAQERRAVALANCALSRRNYAQVRRAAAALGVDPENAALGMELLNKTFAALAVPATVQKSLFESALAAARTLQLGVALSHPSVNPLAAHRIKAFRQLVQHDGGSLRLHFPDEDVGFVYHRGAVCSSAKHSVASETGALVVGRRLPHVYVDATSRGAHGRALGTGGDGTCSSLDLVDTRARCLTLFVSASSDGQSWSSAAATMNDERDREHASSGASCSGRQLTVVTMRASEWLGLCTRREQLGSDAGNVATPPAAVLVRPDAHIAWIAPCDADGGECTPLDGHKQALLRAVNAAAAIPE